ncbi:MAG: rbfA [Clostridiales bacterium]|jgi:ribosome-binding factor A|nr:rbfA [Clostridiales bacterium]
MSVDRLSKLSEQIKKEISNIIQTEIKDPRVPILTSIVHVDVTKDLRYAKVFISVFGEEEKKVKCIEGLKSASGYIRKEVGSRMNIRYIPELIFEIDRSIEYGMHIDKVIKEMKKNNDTSPDR